MNDNIPQIRFAPRPRWESVAEAEFRAAGAPTRVARALVYGMEIQGLAQLRGMRWEDGPDRERGLGWLVATTPGCGAHAVEIVKALHAGTEAKRS